MTTPCPDGHDSVDVDYCSVCGLAMEAPTPVREAAPTARAAAPLLERGGSCANCGEAHGPEDVFCESCGLDFASGTLPDPDPEPALTSTNAGAGAVGGPVASAATLTITVDRDHYERMDSEGVLSYPDPVPAPVSTPLRDGSTLIGRAKPERGIHPDVDLSAAAHPDAAASTRHAVIEHRADGSWWVTDLDSTNGTFVGTDARQLSANTPTVVQPGTPIFVGAWTRLVIETASDGT